MLSWAGWVSECDTCRCCTTAGGCLAWLPSFFAPPIAGPQQPGYRNHITGSCYKAVMIKHQPLAILSSEEWTLDICMVWNYEAMMLWRDMFWILKIIFIVECWRFFYRLNLTKLKNESSLVQGGRKESWVGPNSINQSAPVSSQWPVPSSRYTNHSRHSRASNEGSQGFHNHRGGPLV